MIYRILFFLLMVMICFIPIYLFLNFLYKKFNIYSNSNNLITEIEKNKNQNEFLAKELENKLNELEEIKEQLNKVKENK